MSKPKITERVHPEFEAFSSHWEFLLASYVGGRGYVDGNLFKYFKEGTQEFDARKARAYRENHSKRVVDLVNSYLFKEQAKRAFSNDRLTEFMDNVDGRGKNIVQFMKVVSLFASVLGRVYVVMDKKPLPEEQRTGTQADNLTAMPYCYLVYPQRVKDIAFDENGRIKWCVIEEEKRDDEDPLESSGDVETRYRLWMKGEWRLFDADGGLIEQGQTGLDVVPIVIVNSEEQDEYVGQSLIGDVAYLDRAIFNNWSRLDTIVCDQTFSQLIFPIEGLPAEVVENEELRNQFLVLATNRVILYSASAQAAPCFISPDASQADFILRMIEKQVKQLYASIGLQGETATEVTAQSGLAKAYDFDKLNKLLASKADNLETAELEMVTIFEKWLGALVGAVEIDYPDEFDVKSLTDEIAQAQELALLNISETFTKEIQKNIVLKALPKAPDDVIETIMEEIEKKQEPPNLREAIFDFDKGKGGAEDDEEDEEE